MFSLWLHSKLGRDNPLGGKSFIQKEEKEEEKRRRRNRRRGKRKRKKFFEEMNEEDVETRNHRPKSRVGIL